MKILSNEEVVKLGTYTAEKLAKFGPSKIQNIKLDLAYRSIRNEQEILDFFEEETIHCVSCKVDLVSDPDITYPVKNSLSISVLRLDGSMINGVPYLVCTNCEYKNSVIKLLKQV